jgi:O-antigen/teichoic acid export membrane protein
MKFLKGDELLKHASIMFIATVVGGACNYIYQLYMGRALGPEAYGVFGSLFAIFYLISVLTGTIQTGGARFVSKFSGKGEQGNIHYFLAGLQKRMVFLGIISFLVFVSISGWIASFLKIGSIMPVIILGTVFLFSLLLPVNLSALHGLQKFVPLGYNTVLNFSSKLIFGVILVSIGFGVNGALGALTIGIVIALIASFFSLRTFLSKDPPKEPNPSFKFSELYVYSVPTMIAMFCFAVPANVDVIIAKHFFTAHSAGLYTAASVLGKIILFLPGAITVVMFPKVSEMYTQKKDTSGILNRSLLYTGMLSGVVAVGYWSFPYLAVKIPFGYEYMEAIPLIKLYGVTMFFFSLTVVLMQYSLAIHDLKYVNGFAFFTFIEIGLLSVFHSSMMEMVMILLIVNVALFIFSYCYVSRRIITQYLVDINPKY